jgi:hypothetical protein
VFPAVGLVGLGGREPVAEGDGKRVQGGLPAHGSPRKEIVSPAISPRGFAYVAWREHELGASSRALVATTTWRRWLLDADAVILMFDRVARLGLLRFSSAGSVVRVDWLAQSLAEVTGAAA